MNARAIRFNLLEALKSRAVPISAEASIQQNWKHSLGKKDPSDGDLFRAILLQGPAGCAADKSVETGCVLSRVAQADYVILPVFKYGTERGAAAIRQPSRKPTTTMVKKFCCCSS